MADEGSFRTEREEAREKLRASIDALTQQASLQVQMQKEPLKMLGGASAAGAVIGLIVGRQFRRSKKIYVDASSPVKHQKALVKAQARQNGRSLGGALAATLGTLAFKTLMDRVVTPRLEELSGSLLERAGQAHEPGKAQPAARPALGTGRAGIGAPQASSAKAAAPAPSGTASSGTASFVKSPAPSAPAPAPHAPAQHTPDPAGTSAPEQSYTAQAPAAGSVPPAHPGIRPMPESQVEAKAVSSAISPEEKRNPNAL